MFKFIFNSLILITICFAPLSSHASLFDDDEARKAILDLRAKVEQMQHDVEVRIDTGLGNKADKSSLLDLSNQNQQLLQELAQLRGKIEVVTNELANVQFKQKDFYIDLDSRLRKLEPQKISVDGKETSIDPFEQKSYDAALSLFKAGDYQNAGLTFSEFLRRYPQSGYAPSAQYWLGNSYYAEKDYKNALAAQQVVIKKYPDSTRVADALLNIASCYTELKDKAAAKKTLEALIARYPESTAGKTAKNRLAQFK